jgi:hypothetical protein
MIGKRFWKVIIALMIVTGLVLGGVVIYQAGYAHGAMTGFSLPANAEHPVVPFDPMLYGYHMGPRVGLLGLFPLLCFGGFFYLLLIFGMGIFARKRAWMHYGPGAHPHNWRHSEPPPPPGWNQENHSDREDPSQADASTASVETEKSE